jgi:hypothetical protein
LPETPEHGSTPFGVTWHTLLDALDELPPDATFVTPLSGDSFRLTEIQAHRVVIDYRDDGGTVPLQREQFETLHRRVTDARDGFDLDRLPPDAEPYATVSSVHPRFEVDDRAGTIAGMDRPTATHLVDASPGSEGDGDEEADREEVTSVDAGKVDDALEVTDIRASDVYEVEEREYVRKAEVGEAVEESRLQGLEDRLAAADGDESEADEPRRKIEELEARIEELTSFSSGQAFHTESSGTL